MADKAISELVAAPSVTPDSLFVLQQDGTAKKLTAQVLENWLLSFADGHGGIQSYELLNTVGLVKTYRFTLADQTHIDIDVVDGRGIESVKPTSTVGLVVTYTITYNDGNTDTITVTNGEKGDKGDNANVWIRYASQKPTASSHSFGEVADAWIGICSNHLETAPTDWQQYQWYQWKGEKGDTGDPAVRERVTTEYQVGDAVNIVPSGQWLSSIPNVPQGKYLWIRKTTVWNRGDTDVDYSVSRMGIDGSGAVSTVAGVSPDADGNVPLTASDVKALPIGGGTMEGPINMNGQSLSGLNAPTKDDEAATKGYVDDEIAKIDVSSQISGKVDKTSVVNNFTTTEEGFVADARALKVLNDKIFLGPDIMNISTHTPLTNTVVTELTADKSGYYRVTANTNGEAAECQALIGLDAAFDIIIIGSPTINDTWLHLFTEFIYLDEGDVVYCRAYGNIGLAIQYAPPKQ